MEAGVFARTSACGHLCLHAAAPYHGHVPQFGDDCNRCTHGHRQYDAPWDRCTEASQPSDFYFSVLEERRRASAHVQVLAIISVQDLVW